MNLADFHFIRPYWLLALIPWFGIVVMTARHKLQQGNWSKVCDEALLPFILQQKAVNRSRLLLTTGALAGLLAICALSGPAWERLPVPVFRNDSALVIALDLSRSMNTADVKPTRLIRARYKIADILKQRKDGQTALLVYAGDAFTVTPLTNDTDTIVSQLSALTTDIMPSQGSDTSTALKRAVELLKQAGLQQGHILLITDGVDFDSAEAAVKSLGAYKLSILGVGTAAGAPIRAAEGGFVKDRQGNIVVPKLDADELTRLAERGHGIYQTINANDRDITALAAYFESQVREKSGEQSDLQLQQWVEKGPWLLLLVMPLAALGFRKGLLSVALLFLLPFPKPSYAMEWRDLWQTQDQQAQKAYQTQQFEQAGGQFQDPEWKAAAQYRAGHFDQVLETLKDIETADSFYNQGNALAQSGQLAEAAKAYEKALALDSEYEDARYNKEIVEKELEKQKQEQSQQPGDDQKNSDHDSEQDKQGDSPEKSGEQPPSDQQNESGQQQQDDDHPSESQNRQENTGQQDAAEPDVQQTQEEQAQEKQEQAGDQDDKQEKELSRAAQADADQSQDETQQANEQWLKRIPDDPAGLLRRKFLYQYGQRGRQSDRKEDW